MGTALAPKTETQCVPPGCGFLRNPAEMAQRDTSGKRVCKINLEMKEKPFHEKKKWELNGYPGFRGYENMYLKRVLSPKLMKYF